MISQLLNAPMNQFVPWWAWLIGALWVGGMIYAFVTRPVCLHHWHSIDGWTEWRCCWCGNEKDGWPRDGSVLCWYKHRRQA